MNNADSAPYTRSSRHPGTQAPSGTGTLSRLRRPVPVLAMALAWIAIGAWLYARSTGLNPAIFADEWYYSKMARLQPLAEAIVPSWLYLWIFSASNACGDGFLDCVRFGNDIFFAGAAPFIYLSARQVAGRGMAFAVTVLALLAPANLYTALFMPEACYYFGFAVLAWVALTRSAWGWAGQGAATGLVLGLMSLIKVHALFLLPGVCLFLACAGQLRGETAWLRRGMLSAVLAALLALAIKFGLGWVLAGEAGLSVFGSFYANTADTTARSSKLALLAPAFINGRGHLMGLAVLLPLPLAMIFHALLSRAARARLDAPMKSLLLFSFLMLGSAAGLTVVYTASIRAQGVDEILRLHLRYYSFVFPLLLMVAAAALGKPLPGSRARAAWVAAVLVAAAILAAQLKLPLYRLSMIDGPELASLAGWPGQALAALELLVLVLWACGSRLAAPLFMFAALPLAAGAGLHENAFYLAQLRTSWAPEKAGRFAHAYVPVAQHNRIAVVAETTQEVMRTQFQIDAPDVAPIELPKGAPIEPYHIPARTDWLLVIGKHPLPEGMTPVATTEDYALVKLRKDFRLAGSARLSEPYGQGIVSGAEGLSHDEPWGRWSNAKRVVLHFSRPLPKHVRIGFKARAFNVNATLPFMMRIGDQEKTFRVSEYEQELSLEFTTDGARRSLDIEVPQPVSPHELGLSIDVRKLGIGLSAIEVYDTGPR